MRDSIRRHCDQIMKIKDFHIEKNYVYIYEEKNVLAVQYDHDLKQ